jgi:hypothetical protein
MLRLEFKVIKQIDNYSELIAISIELERLLSLQRFIKDDSMVKGIYSMIEKCNDTIEVVEHNISVVNRVMEIHENKIILNYEYAPFFLN